MRGTAVGGREVESEIADLVFCWTISCLTASSSEDAAVLVVTAVDVCWAISCLTASLSEDAAVLEVIAVDFGGITSSLSASGSEDGEVWEGSTVVICGGTSCVTTLSSPDFEGWESSAVGGAFKLVVVSARIEEREGRNGKLGGVGLSAGTVGDAGGEK